MLSVPAVLGESWRIYRLLWHRSLLAAVTVYLVVAGISWLQLASSRGVGLALGPLEFIASNAGPVFLQGTLILLVAHLHEGLPAGSVAGSVRSVTKRFWSLFWASVLYGFGVVIGLVLLVVPGVLAASRWSLMAPAVVVENRKTLEALDRSRELVAGQTRAVLWIVLVLTALTSGPQWVAWWAFGATHYELAGSFVWSAVTAPLYAHALTVVYFRLADPERPVIAESVRGWRSVWAGT